MVWARRVIKKLQDLLILGSRIFQEVNILFLGSGKYVLRLAKMIRSTVVFIPQKSEDYRNLFECYKMCGTVGLSCKRGIQVFVHPDKQSAIFIESKVTRRSATTN